MFCLLLLLSSVGSSFAAVHVRNQPQQTHLRAPKSAPLVANATKVGMLPEFLARMANECKCVFEGVCTCDLEMKFMNCIKDACETGKCACEGVHFLDACKAMDATCPDGGLQCSADKASCVNGAVVTRPGAAAAIVPAPKPATEAAPAPLNSTVPATPPAVTFEYPAFYGITLAQRLWGALVYAVFATLFAYLYFKYIVEKEKESFGEKHAGTFFTMKKIMTFKHNDFNTGLFDCFHAPKLCLLSCCCSCLVWSHTSDRSGIYKRLTYWPAFAICLILLTLTQFTNGWVHILVVILGTVYRQAMRKQYNISACTPATITKDFLAWLCCTPCAITQEHTEEHFQATHAFAH